MRSIGTALSIGVTAPLAIIGRDALRLANEQEDAMALVRNGVETTGAAAGLAADNLFRIASGLQETSRFGDEDILRNVTTQLLTFTNIANDQFERSQQAILDVATVLDADLKSTAIQVGKALNDPVKGLSALSRSGITFSEEQTNVIKALAETGRVAEAQSLILDEIENQYGGSAAAAAETFAGQTVQLANAWGDVKEEFGAIIREFLPPLIDFLRNAVDFVRDLDPATKQWAVGLAAVSAAVGPLLIPLGFMVAGMAALSTPVLALVGTFTAIAAGIIVFRDEIRATIEFVRDFAKSMSEALSAIPEFLTRAEGLDGRGERRAGRDIGAAIGEGVAEGIRETTPLTRGAMRDLTKSVESEAKEQLGIQSPSTVFAEIGRNVVQGFSQGIVETGSLVGNSMSDILQGLDQQVTGLFEGVLLRGESFASALSGILDTIGGRLIDSAVTGLFGGLGIPGFASGTNYAPGGLALVGERGPELVNLPRGSQVVPNHRLGSMAGGAVIVQNVFNFTANGDESVKQIIHKEAPRIAEMTVAAVGERNRRDPGYLGRRG
ncbi:MAG: phage tail length tape measure family protein [Pseudomonadota bacterium]